MSKFTAPAAYTEGPRPPIALVPVTSGQIRAVGYDAATETLAVTFNRGAGAIYHYPNVKPELYEQFMAAESLGQFFGQHIQSLPFDKYPAEPAPEPTADAA